MDNRKKPNLPFPDDIAQHALFAFLPSKTLGVFSLTAAHAKEHTANTLLSRLLQYVAYGEQTEAEKILKLNPALLLEKGTVVDYSGRTIQGTALQIALGAEDVGYQKDEECMVEMIQRYFDKLPDGKQALATQITEQFPEGWEEKENERAKNDSDALNKVIQAIADSNDNDNCEAALQAFRDYLAPKDIIKTGKHFNAQLLMEASKLYDDNYSQFGGYDSHKNNICWRKVIGTIQRFLPACYAQAFCQGIYGIVEDGEILRRRLKFRFGKNPFFFPLDSESAFRLGVDYAGSLGGVPTGAGVGRELDGSVVVGRGTFKTYAEQKFQTCRTYAAAAKCDRVFDFSR